MTTTTAPDASAVDTGKRYFIVSADCHVAEPPDLWETHIDARFRSRLPRIEVDASGQKWSVVEGHRPVRVRDLQLEGEDLERSKAGSRDPEERVRDHARDGIDAEVIYPNRGLQMWASPDAQMQAAMCRVWNDWAIELFRGYEQRMAPVAAVAPADVDGAVAEVERVAQLGYRGVFLPVQPLGTAPPTERRLGYHLPQFEPLWAAIAETGMPISFHVGSGKDPRTASGKVRRDSIAAAMASCSHRTKPSVVVSSGGSSTCWVAHSDVKKPPARMRTTISVWRRNRLVARSRERKMARPSGRPPAAGADAHSATDTTRRPGCAGPGLARYPGPVRPAAQ